MRKIKQLKKRAEKYEPLVRSNLPFETLLKLGAHTPPPKDIKRKVNRAKKKLTLPKKHKPKVAVK